MCYEFSDWKSVLLSYSGILDSTTWTQRADLNHAFRQLKRFVSMETDRCLGCAPRSIYLSSYKYFNCKTVVGEDTKLLSAEYSFLVNILCLISPAFHWFVCVRVCAYMWVLYVVFRVQICWQIWGCLMSAINKATERIQGQPTSHEIENFSSYRSCMNLHSNMWFLVGPRITFSCL